MPATKAADCGVSSNSCRRSNGVGVASALYSIVQEMGRVDRVPLGDDVEVLPNRYEVHLSFTCAVKLYARTMQHPEKTERKRQLDLMMSVLSFLMVPNDCQHVILERYFEDQNATRGSELCLNSCSMCRRKQATGRINRHKLTSLLMGYCSSSKSPTTAALVKFVREKQTLIFHKSALFAYSLLQPESLCSVSQKIV